MAGMAAFYGRTHLSDSWTSWSSEKSEYKEGDAPQLFWVLLMATAVLSNLFFLLLDQVAFLMSVVRDFLTSWLLLAVLVDALLAGLARLVARSTMEAQGNGFPELKAMLWGKVILHYLSLRVLSVKALSLALGIAAGLPVGLDGPHVHMAACILRALHPQFFDSMAHAKPHGAGAEGPGSLVQKLLLAACATGFAQTSAAPVGGVLMALELMLPQTYDATAYWGCFTAAILGAVLFSVERTLGGVPLLNSNILPGEGEVHDFPVLELLLDLLLGVLCGLAGGLWVRSHELLARRLRSLRSQPQRPRLKTEPPRSHSSFSRFSMLSSFLGWDVALVGLLAASNTLLVASLPLLAGHQPRLIERIFDKHLMEGDWVLPWAGVLGTLLLCLASRWAMTLWALSSEIPAGLMGPMLIIGGLLGRVFAEVLPLWFLDVLLSCDGRPPDEAQRRAFGARCAIIGASSFSAAVCRAFAMAITVFEALMLPNSVLPLCSSALGAIWAANQVSLPFFDSNLAEEDLAGIPAITFSWRAIEPVMKVMDTIHVERCLPQVVTQRHMQKLVYQAEEDFLPIIRPHDGQALLVGTTTPRQALELLRKLGDEPSGEVDLLSSEFRCPADGSEPLVEMPIRIPQEHTVKDAYLLMKMYDCSVIYVTDRGILKGSMTLGTLLCRDL